MTSRFEFDVEWVPGLEKEEVGIARLALFVNDQNPFRCENRWGRNVVEDRPVLSALRLAEWLAGNWWRLRWEDRSQANLADWKMSHHLAAAGGGFLWPDLRFWSDGDDVFVTCRPTPTHSSEVFRYLSDFEDVAVPTPTFEAGVDAYLSVVLEGLAGTTAVRALDAIWQRVQEERQDPAAALQRRLEALLGSDPEEGDPLIIRAFCDRALLAGTEAIADVAAACSGPDAATHMRDVFALAETDGPIGKFAAPPDLDGEPPTGPAHRSGTWVARHLRSHLGLRPQDKLQDQVLADLLGLPAERFAGPRTASLLGLAITKADGSAARIHFRKNPGTGRRFEAARMIGDALFFGRADAWHPVTDRSSARQRRQRAFAVELLAPFDGLREHLPNDASDEAIEEAAQYYDVSEWIVRRHLENNGVPIQYAF